MSAAQCAPQEDGRRHRGTRRVEQCVGERQAKRPVHRDVEEQARSGGEHGPRQHTRTDETDETGQQRRRREYPDDDHPGNQQPWRGGVQPIGHGLPGGDAHVLRPTIHDLPQRTVHPYRNEPVGRDQRDPAPVPVHVLSEAEVLGHLVAHRGVTPNAARPSGGNDPCDRSYAFDTHSYLDHVTMPQQTLLVALAHPDDELGAAGTILAQRARGDRVVVLWLTRGEMTEAFGPLPPEEVAERRLSLSREAARLLGAEARALDMPDTRLTHTPDAVDQMACVIAEIRPDGVLTWGDAWTRGMRHPDHLACGRIVRDAVTVARIRKRVAPREPHRAAVPLFTFRDQHSTLPAVTVDISAHLDGIHEVAALYQKALGFGDPAWLDARLRRIGEPHGLRFAEEFDAWETGAGVVQALLPALPEAFAAHPTRQDGPAADG